MMKTQRKTPPYFMLRLLMYFLVIIVLVSAVAVVFIQLTQQYNQKTLELTNEMLRIQRVRENIQKSQQSMEDFHIWAREEHHSNFESSISRAQIEADQLLEQYPSQAFYRDISVMIDSYADDAKQVFEKMKSGEQENIYYKGDVMRLGVLAEAIQQEIQQAISAHLGSIRSLSFDTYEQVRRSSLVTYMIVGGSILLCIYFAYRFSKQISQPIVRLAEKFQFVANGDLKVREQLPRRYDEVGILISSFNHMVGQLEIAMENIQQKAQLEKTLGEERLKNSEMNSLLQQAKLNYLQMQINPHFLFNTFNSISALAVIEEAPNTAVMINKLSGLVRYTMQQIEKTVTLQQELEITENYLFIQKQRFEHRLLYRIQADEDCLALAIPAMVLQPLVENAIIHGIEPQEEGGFLWIRAYCEGGELVLTVEDNGQGMDKEVLEGLSHNLAQIGRAHV